MKMRFLIILLAVCPPFPAGLFTSLSAASTPRPPNIVLILADDLGWADVGADASTFYRTPRIDALAGDGIRFTDAYAAAPVCSPDRAALLTGKYPARLHLTDWLPGRPDQPDQMLASPVIVQHLPLEEITLAEALKPAGYVSAHIGKWHLGGEGYSPLQQGFDLNIGGNHFGWPLSYFAPYESDGEFIPGLEQAPDGEYLTDRVTDEALKFIDANRDRPFFLYLPHFAVHIPLAAKQALIESNRARTPTGPQTNAIYAAMIDSLDNGVGRVLDELEKLGLADNTVVVFTSDNGGLSVVEGPNTPSTSNAPLRNGKGYLQEGGIRVPLMVRWPGHIQPGRIDRTPVSSIDLYPTLLAMAGIAPGHAVDGVDLSGLVMGSATLPPRALYWHYPHYANQARSPQAPSGGGPGAAIREGRWKLIEYFETDTCELHDLQTDIGETHDLSDALPDKVAEMRAHLKAWQDSVGAQWPTPNPDYKRR